MKEKKNVKCSYNEKKAIKSNILFNLWMKKKLTLKTYLKSQEKQFYQFSPWKKETPNKAFKCAYCKQSLEFPNIT